MKTRHEDSFFSFMESVAARLDRLEKQRTAETYMSALKSFRRFVGRPRLAFSELDTDLTTAYEAYLIRRRGLAPNTSSFYMRILRAAYNRAVNQGLTTQNNPFRGVYTGVARTAKRDGLPAENRPEERYTRLSEKENRPAAADTLGAVHAGNTRASYSSRRFGIPAAHHH